MCIIVSKPYNKKLDRKIWKECFQSNKDGAGFSYIKDKKLIVEKGFFNFDDFYKAMLPHETQAMTVHFRRQTHGGISEDNCHPFLLQSKKFPRFSFAIAHNGQLPWNSSKTESDTALFCKQMLQPILDRDPLFFDTWTGVELMERYITAANKMVIFRYDSEKNEYDTTILNEKLGNDSHGCWFSNYSWRPVPNYALGYGGSEDNDPLHGWSKEGGRWVHKDHPKGITSSPVVPATPVTEGTHDIPKPVVVVKDENGDMVDVVVPRDEGVLTEENLNHLTRSEKKTLRRIVADFLKDMKVDMKGKSDLEKIVMCREELRGLFKECQGLPDVAMDQWIISHADYIPSGNATPETASP